MPRSSARTKPVAIGVVTKTVYVDDYNDAIYANVVYPTDITIAVFSYIDGSDYNIISGVCDISASTGSSIQISGQALMQYSLNMTTISGAAYPT